MPNTLEELINRLKERTQGAKFLVWNFFGRIVGSVVGFGLGGGSRERLQQKGRAKLTPALLDPDTLTILRYLRGENFKQFFEEQLAKQGFSKDQAERIFSAGRSLLQLDQLVTLKIRGELTEEEYIKKARENRFTQEDAMEALQLADERIGVAEATELIVRNLTEDMSEEELINEMKESGWSDERIQSLLQLAKFHPSVQDIVRWTGKEVFEPATINKIGMAEEYEVVARNLPPDSRFDVTEKDIQIISGADGDIEEIRANDEISNDAKNLLNEWISHWEHPSFRRFREMYARVPEVDDEVYDIWARIIELPPFWRDAFKEVLHRTLSRVDVRRMWQLDVITTREELVQTYKELRYNDEDAEAMADFTIKFYQDPSQEEETQSGRKSREIDDLTRARIQNAYEDGRIDRDEAKDLLVDILESEFEAEFYLGESDMEILEDRQQPVIDANEEMYKQGLISETQASENLDDLGLRDQHKQRLLYEWRIDRETSTRLPTKSDLLRFLEKGIIEEDLFRHLMERSGFKGSHIDLYIQDLNQSE